MPSKRWEYVRNGKITWSCSTNKIKEIISSYPNYYKEELPKVFLFDWILQIGVVRMEKKYNVSSPDETSVTDKGKQEYKLRFYLIRDSHLELKCTNVKSKLIANSTVVKRNVDIFKDLVAHHIGEWPINNIDEIDYQINLHLNFKDYQNKFNVPPCDMHGKVNGEEVGHIELKKSSEFVKQEKEEHFPCNNLLNQDLISWERAQQEDRFFELSFECMPAGTFELNIPCKEDIQTKGTKTIVSERTNTETSSNEIAGPSEQKKVSEHMFNNISNNAGAKKEQINRSKEFGNALKYLLKNNKILESCQAKKMDESVSNNISQSNRAKKEEAENTGQNELIKYSLNELIEIKKDCLLKPSKETTSKIVNISKTCGINLMRKQTEDHKKEFTKRNLETAERIKLNITEETEFLIQNKESESGEENDCTKLVEQKVIEANQIFEQSLKVKLNEQDKNHRTENKDLLEQSKETSVNIVDQIKACGVNIFENPDRIQSREMKQNTALEQNLESRLNEDDVLCDFVIIQSENTGMEESNSEFEQIELENEIEKDLLLKQSKESNSEFEQIELENEIEKDLFLKQSKESISSEDLNLCELTLQSEEAENTGMKVSNSKSDPNEPIEIEKDLLLKQSKKTTSSEDMHLCALTIQSEETENIGMKENISEPTLNQVTEIRYEMEKNMPLKQSSKGATSNKVAQANEECNRNLQSKQTENWQQELVLRNFGFMRSMYREFCKQKK